MILQGSTYHDVAFPQSRVQGRPGKRTGLRNALKRKSMITFLMTLLGSCGPMLL
jgi:hypothetical protein